MITAKEIIAHREAMQNEQQREVLMGFFKTGLGEYGEGDEFLGLKVPQTREVVKEVWKGITLDEVPELLQSSWHEVRLCGLLILVAKFEAAAKKKLEQDAKAICTRDEILPSEPTTGTWWTSLPLRFWEGGSCSLLSSQGILTKHLINGVSSISWHRALTSGGNA